MITSRTFLVIAAVATLAGFACPATQATQMPIAGLLNIKGSAPGPGGSSGSASFLGVGVNGPRNGAFGFLQTGAPVAIASPSIFFDSSAVALSLWSVGGFTLELENPIHDPNNPYKIDGTATIFAPGAAPVSGVEWTYTSLTGGTFTLRLTSSNLVPDSGTTMALLGLGLVAIAVCRAKFATR